MYTAGWKESNSKHVVDFVYKFFSETFLILRRVELDMIKFTHVFM